MHVSDPEMAAGTVRGERPNRSTSGTVETPGGPPRGGGSALWRYGLPIAAGAAGLGALALAGNRDDDKQRNLVYAPAPYG